MSRRASSGRVRDVKRLVGKWLGYAAVAILGGGLFFSQCVAPFVWPDDCLPGYSRTITLGSGNNRCEADSEHAEVLSRTVRELGQTAAEYNSDVVDALNMLGTVAAISKVALFLQQSLDSIAEADAPPDDLRDYSQAVQLCLEDILTGYQNGLREASAESPNAAARIVYFDIDFEHCNRADKLAGRE